MKIKLFPLCRVCGHRRTVNLKTRKCSECTKPRYNQRRG